MNINKTLTCPHCGKEFPYKGKKKFCSTACCQRYNAKIYYRQHKDEIEFKDKKKERFDKWRKNNRERFNDLAREPSRLSGIKRRKFRKENKLCFNCGIKILDEYLSCPECREKRRLYIQTKKNSNKIVMKNKK